MHLKLTSATFFTTLTTLAIFTLLFLSFLHPITAITQDLGRHILTGKIIFQTHHVPKTNLFSYTYPDYPFINHHWFSEVIFYSLVQIIGFTGLLLITTVIATVAFGLIFFFAHKRSSISALGIASLLYFPVLFERTDLRPEIFSFFFLAVFIIILYKYREAYTPWIFLLIPIELLWVNMHIYFFIGIVVLSLFFLDLLIFKINNLSSQRVFTLLVIITICSLITILNPNGLQGALYPFHVLQSYGYSVEENQNIFLLWSLTQNIRIIWFTIAAGLLFINLFLAWKKTKPVDWMLSIFFTIFATMAIRNFPLFVFATFVPLTIALHHTLHYIFHYLHNHKTIVLVIPIQTSILFLIGWQIVSLFFFGKVGFHLSSEGESAIHFYITHHIAGPVFNNFDIGSFMEYRLYPQQKLFVDGRPEAYPSSFFQGLYLPMQQDPAIFAQADHQYHFNSIFFSHTDQTPWATQFIKTIVNNNTWRIVYLDDYIVILVKNNEKNKSLIDTYSMNQQSVHIPNFSSSDSNKLFAFAHFFNEAGWNDQEKSMYEKILAIHPDDCNALYNLTIILSQETAALGNVYSNRYTARCQ